MKLVYKVLQPGAVSSNDDHDTKNLFFSRKRMENVDMQYSFLKKQLCARAGQIAVWANDVTFVQMKLGTGKKIAFVFFTLTWKFISFGLDILH